MQSSHMEIQGGRFQYRQSSISGGRRGGGVRGTVQGLSDASRRRLSRKFASVDYQYFIVFGVPIWFITVTTTPEYWDRPGYCRQALERVYDRLRYDFAEKGFLGGIWRRERGAKRGMLHYHLMLFGPEIDQVRFSRWWNRTWSECLRHSGKPLRTDVQCPESPKRIAKYLGKYCAKAGYERATTEGAAGGDGQEPTGATAVVLLSKAHISGNDKESEKWGRWWGVWGKDEIPWAPVEVMEGTDEDLAKLAKRIRRLYRKWLARQVEERAVKKVRRVLPADVVRHFEGKIRAAARNGPGFHQALKRGGGGFTLLIGREFFERLLDGVAVGL